uniref:Uncharacterized protein n=1 Tax=Anguilla anguilla TaxID=7936 RepID=A0A0E9PEP8_ANGAN
MGVPSKSSGIVNVKWKTIISKLGEDFIVMPVHISCEEVQYGHVNDIKDSLFPEL